MLLEVARSPLKRRLWPHKSIRLTPTASYVPLPFPKVLRLVRLVTMRLPRQASGGPPAGPPVGPSLARQKFCWQKPERAVRSIAKQLIRVALAFRPVGRPMSFFETLVLDS